MMEKMETIPGIDQPLSRLSLGCWPIAGVTSVHVNDVDSKATIQAALDCGINFFDTAFGYGASGESELLLGKVVGSPYSGAVWSGAVIATKAGMELKSDGSKVFDCRPETLVRQCETSLRRLNRDHIDLFYLHAKDGKTPLELVGQTFEKLKQEGKIRAAGVCNLDPVEIQIIHDVSPVSAVQDYTNALQLGERERVRRWCRENGVKFVAYWPLMKGLLAGGLSRDHKFHPADSRQNYPMFQGRQWQLNQDFMQQVRQIANQFSVPITGLVLKWTLQHCGFILCGAKRPNQILQNVSGCYDTCDEAVELFQQALDRRNLAK